MSFKSHCISDYAVLDAVLFYILQIGKYRIDKIVTMHTKAVFIWLKE